MSHQFANPFGLSRAGRVVRWVMSLMLVINVLQPFAAAAREPVETSSAQASRPIGHPAAAEPATVALAPAAPQAVNIVATKRDTFLNDVENDGLADPGDTIRYTLIVTNTGTTDATSVNINDTIDTNTTLVAGSVLVSPLARDDAYNAVGNTLLAVGVAAVPNVPTASVAGSVFDNDSEFLGDTFTLQSFQAASANGGTVAVNANGSFTYLPAAGFTGVDTFTYTITDGTLNAVGTVTITVANRVWYVDTAAAAGGTGRSNSPFNTVAPVNGAGGAGDVDDVNDVIFFHTGSTNYTALELENSQSLIGRGVPLVVGGFTLLGAGTAPTMGGPGTLVTLASNNTVMGLTITSQTTGMGIAGTNFGSATITNTSLNGGPALSLTTGALTGSFPTLSSAGGSTGVSLTGVTGNFIGNAGTMSGISGTDFALDGGTIAVGYGGAITNSAGRSISIINRTSGTVTFSGAINDTGTGMLIQNNGNNSITFASTTQIFNTGANTAIRIASNSGSTIRFISGNLNVTTSTGTGMDITGNGTVQVTGANNTINATSGKALNMTTALSGGMTFKSISANVSAGVGVTLNGIGSGGFTVTGTGTTNGSGGVIQNTNRGYEIISATNVSLSNIQLTNAAQNNAGSGCDSSVNTGCNAAIFLSSATAVVLDNVDINGVNQIGINGATVNGFTLNNSTVINCGNEVNEGCLRFSNLSGTSAISASDIALNPTAGFNGERAVWIDNTSGTLTLNVTSSIFRDTFNSPTGADGFELDVRGTAIATLDVSGSDFLRNGTMGLQVLTADTATANVKATTSDFDYDTATVGRGIELASTQSSTLNFDISGNSTIKGKGGVGLAVILADNTRGNGFIKNNAYIAGTPGSTGSAVLIRTNNTAQLKVEVSGNTVDKQGSDNGITIENPTTGGTSRIDAVVTGNTITTNTQAAYGIQLVALINNTICGYVANNVVTELGTGGGSGQLGAFRARSSATGAVLLLEGFNTDVPTTWINNGNTPANPARIVTSGTGSITGGTCTRPVAFRPAAAEAAPAQPAAELIAAEPVDAAPVVDAAAAVAAPDAASRRPAAATGGAQALAPTSGETVTVNVGTLPAGKRLIIIFDAMVNTPLSVPTATNISNQASISGGNFANVLSNDPDTVAPNDPTLTPIDRRSSLSLAKSDGGVSAAPGDTINYTLTITNAILRPSASTVLTETVPANTTFNAGASSAGWVCAPNINAGSSCTLAVGNLDGNSTTTRIFAVSVISPVPAGVASVSNTATVGDTASTSELTPADNTASDTTPIIATPDLRITKSDNGASVTPGNVVVYTLAYTNTGNQGATGVVLSETVPANSTFNAGASSAGWVCAPNNNAGSVCTLTVGALAGGGASGTRLFAVTAINPVGAGVSQLSNTASVADDGTNGADPTPANNITSDTTPLTAAPDLSITKSDGGASVAPGGTVAYALNFINNGNQAATGVMITETVPANTTFNVPLSSPGWSCAHGAPAGTVCTFPVGALAVGVNNSATFAVTVVAAVPAGVTQISNTASVGDDGANGADLNPANNTASDTTPLNAAPDLVITKSDGGASAFPGIPFAYTLAYTNTGNQDANGVVLTETVPSFTTFNAGASSPGWVCAPNNNAGSSCTIAVGNLAVGASGNRAFAVTPINPAPPGVSQINNIASIADNGANGADLNPANNSASDTTPLNAAPDMRLTKSDGGITAGPLDVVAYTLSITNAGNQGATGIVINETVPLHTTFNAGASTGTWSCANGAPAGTVCTSTVGNLAGGGAVTSRIFAVTVVDPLPNGVTSTTNTASVADDGTNGSDPNPGNNTGSDTTPLSAEPDLGITKSDGGASVVPGGTVAYTLSYVNSGTRAASGVVITETVPLHTTFNPGASSPGWSCTPNNTAGSICTIGVGTVNGRGGSGTRTFAVTAVAIAPTGAELISNTASIGDDGTGGIDPNPANNSASDTTPFDAAPDLVINKSDGGVSTVPGGTILYTLTYSNTGNQNASGVVITETVPLNTTFNAPASAGGWSCADGAPAGSICTITIGTMFVGPGIGNRGFAVNVINPVPAGVNQISNTASIGNNGGANGADLNPANNSASDTTPLTAAPDLSTTKSDGGASTVPGGGVSYTLSYVNNGNQGATGVVLTETVPANTTFNAGASTAGWGCAPNGNAGSTCTLPVGGLAGGGASGTAIFAVSVINPVPAGVNQISNTASIADDGANGPDPTPANNSGSDTTPLTAAPVLALSKSDGGVSAVPGGTINYTLAYTNTGNQGATGVVLSETVPANTTFSGAGWICAPNNNAGSTCTVNIGALTAGSSSTRVFAVTVANPVAAGVEQISNTANITDDGSNSPAPATATASDTTPVTAAPDLTIDKTDAGISVVPGQTLVYTLTIANSGNQSASGVTLSETVPANTTFNAGASGAGWSCANGSPAGTVCTISIGTLAGAGASAGRTFAVSVNNPIAAGVASIENTASVTDDGASGADPTPGNNTDSESTPVNAAPVLTLTKSDGGVSVAPGGTINYTLSYANSGNQGATGVVLTETVPANTTFNAGASSAGWSCANASPAGTVCTFAVGALGASGTAVFAVTVINPVPAGVTLISNTASVTDDGANSAAPATASASDTTPLNITLDLSVTKSVTPALAKPGDPITYTITFASSGNTIVSGVRITDTLPAEVTITTIANTGASIALLSPQPNLVWGASSLAPGASGIITLTGTVNAGLTGEQTITNTVTIGHAQETAPANNSASATFSINLAPTANAGGPYTVDEGSTVQLSAAASTDPGNDPLTFAWDLDNNGSYETAGVTVPFTNTADDAVHTVGLRATDSDGAANTTSTTVTVLNVKPAVNAGADRVAAPNELINFTGVFTDPGVLDTHTIAWNFGDGNTATTTLTPTHAYATPGTYTVTLTITDDDGGVGVDTLLVNVRNNKIYLPLLLSPKAYPDLVVQNVTTTGTSISVVIKNQGTAPVTQALWIDLYLNPNPAPTMVNQIWNSLAPNGMVWGLTNAGLPLQPGQTLILTTNDKYFRRDLSSIPSTIATNTRIFVQVDSANAATTYGAVLESHESFNTAYNNIAGPLLAPQPIIIPVANMDSPENQPDSGLPGRPTAAR